ncbi:MAG: nicotinate-nucleotide adenylyltransferase [Candidatus Omnitrophota bacterium]|nr:nicotinate-nucleotide adenylyltransferase [Candidatus Omnitrophota bacterium]
MRIGILGGTFNPVHIGHLILAEGAIEQLGLSKVIFIPAYLPPHKELKSKITAEQRYHMVKLITFSNPLFEASRLEIIRKGRSYTVDTLRRLREKFGLKQRIFFITGSDCLGRLSFWKEKKEIFKLAEFVIAARPDYPLKNIPRRTRLIKIAPVDISSSDIRKRLKSKKSIRYLVPDAVRNYIVKNKLYC